MVYGDMTVIDGGGEVVRESWLSLVWDGEPPSGRARFGALLAANAATQSSILLRASLSRQLGPVPAAAARRRLVAGAVGRPRRRDRLRCPSRARCYRYHDANIGLGTEGEALGPGARPPRGHAARASCATCRAGEATPLELALAWNAFERNVAEALKHLGNPFARSSKATPTGRRGTRDAAEDLRERAPRALAADPYDAGRARRAGRRLGALAMTRLPHVTALITAYDCERFIGDAVDSVLAQDYAGELDVVVIDDGSTDGTADELAARPDVRVVRQENARLRRRHQPRVRGGRPASCSRCSTPTTLGTRQDPAPGRGARRRRVCSTAT